MEWYEPCICVLLFFTVFVIFLPLDACYIFVIFLPFSRFCFLLFLSLIVDWLAVPSSVLHLTFVYYIEAQNSYKIYTIFDKNCLSLHPFLLNSPLGVIFQWIYIFH